MSDTAGIRAWLSVYLKGVCMGAADTVPGVSGGTIALVVGVYERLITALTALGPDTLWQLRSIHTPEGRAQAVTALLRADVPFLFVLGAGVLSAAATIATGMNIAVTQYPAPTYAFFFGLIAASAVVLFRYVRVRTPRRVLVALLGFTLAFVVTDPSLSGARETTLPMLFFAGAIAISAMVLPGISGAFLLLVMGQYEYVSGIPRAVVDGAIAAFRGNSEPLVDVLVPFVVFTAGAFLGLFSVAYAVRAALARYRQGTLVFLVSLMVGALRLPVNEVAQNVAAVTPDTVAVVGIPAVVGGVAVFLLDRYTDELQY
jgi:putative membrane protein